MTPEISRREALQWIASASTLLIALPDAHGADTQALVIAARTAEPANGIRP
jgi:hypothetical protein